MSLESISRLEVLKDRAHMFKQLRSFFEKRDVTEVDVPMLTQTAPVDVHIDLVKANCLGKNCYLQSSPEYGMKRLLSEGIGNIYQIGHVFRDNERGLKHNPEFVMIEWYKIGSSFEDMIAETLDLLRLFLPFTHVENLSYDQTFLKYGTSEKDPHLDFALNIEPNLGKEGFTVITDFPPSEAALAQIKEKNGKKVALRFEVFHKGYELANGYQELVDPEEQRSRLLEANKKRKALNKEEYPIDERFLAALKKGLPNMCGVACGFDRLMMLKHKKNDIKDVIPFDWDST